MKSSRQTEIEIWYHHGWDTIRIVNKRSPKSRQLYKVAKGEWRQSVYSSCESIHISLLKYEKIGEL